MGLLLRALSLGGLPRGDDKVGNTEALGPAIPPQDICTADDWLRSIAFQDYAAALQEYGNDSSLSLPPPPSLLSLSLFLAK